MMLPATLVLAASLCLLAGASGTPTSSPSSRRTGAGHGASEQPPPDSSGRALPRSGGPRAEPASPASPPPSSDGESNPRGRSGYPKTIKFELTDYDYEEAAPVTRRPPPPVAATERPPRDNPEAPRPPPADTPVIKESFDDQEYEENEDDGDAGVDGGKKPSAAPPRDPGICDYDPCRHGQRPCSVLQQESGCLCVGVVGDAAPDAPRLPEVTFADDLTAEVRWCAPQSEVLDYYVRYREEGDLRDHRTHRIHATWRRFSLRDLAAASRYELCVVAANAAGESACERVSFETPRAYHRVTVACVLAAFLALLVVIAVLAACLCRRRCRGKNRVLITRYDSEDLVSAQNPVFTDDFAKADRVVHLDFGTYGKA